MYVCVCACVRVCVYKKQRTKQKNIYPYLYISRLGKISDI